MKTYKFMPEGWNSQIEELDMQKIYKYQTENKTLQGIVQSCDEQYNLHIILGDGLEGIIPREELELLNQGIPNEKICVSKVHKYIQFKIKDVENNKKIILSRKSVQEETLDYIKNELKIGQTITGIVKNIKPYGAFIEIGGGIVGLAHIEDLSVARIKTPYERLKIGQKINIVVKSINREDGKIDLSYKESLGSWEENAKKFNVGMNVKGIIRETEKNKNGIFIELTPNLVGMAEYSEGYEYGQNVNVYIKKIDMQKKKIKLMIQN